MFDYVTNAMNPAPTLVTEPSQPERGRIKYLPYCDSVVMDVPDSQAALKAQHKSKFWSTLRRKERRFVDTHGDLSFRVISDEDELRRWLPRVRELFCERWADEYTSLPWKTVEGFAPYRDAMITLARRGEAELLVLETGGRLLSFAYCLANGDTYYFYQHATTTAEQYRRFSPGKLLVWKMITHLVDDGRYRFLDFMLGDHDYKHEWGSRSQPVYLKISEERTVTGLARYGAKWAYYSLKIHVQFRNETLRSIAKRLLNIRSRISASDTGPRRHHSESLV